MSEIAPELPRRDRPDSPPRGQIIVIFAFMLTILLGMSAFVVDLAWIWSNQLQVQRAADAGALAGVVHLPADPVSGTAAAQAEARKNGFTDQPDGSPGAQVVAGPDPNFSRRMIVTVSAPVNTFFMGLFGYHEVTVSRTARAEYILPVPMGSPQNYLGVGRLVQNLPSGTDETDWETADATGSPSSWTNDSAGQVSSSNNQRTTHNGNNQAAWRDFDFNVPTDTDILGIEVEIEARKSGTGNCRIGVELSPRADINTQWTSTGFTVPASSNLTGSDTDYTVGDATELWGRTWTESQIENSDFGIRLSRTNVSGSCTVEVDRIRIRVHYQTYADQEVTVSSPYGTPLVPQNFWANIQSQGAPSHQGDAYMTKYTTRTSSVNPNYCPFRGACASNPEGFYNYAIELPNGGDIWVFDPGFCDGSSSRGTAEYFTIGGSTGASDPYPVSAFYRLYNTNSTAWDFTDDTRADSQSNTAVGDGDMQPNTFRRGLSNNAVRYYDSSLRGIPDTDVSWSDCVGTLGHHAWWQVGSNLPAGTYRLHTTSHDRILPNDQNNATALNSFAIWASTAGGGSVSNIRVYGLGAMEAYFPLPAGEVSQFYLAQIEAIHANKWVDISLWDPGDTGGLSADLSILMPTAGGYTPVSFYYNSVAGTTIPTNFTCGPTTSSAVSAIETSSGSGAHYNGQWLRLCFQLPADWSAPAPPADALTPTGCICEGWFRIQYDMGNGSNPSTDLTTWKVEVRGNPVHLITPGDDTPTP